MQKIYRRNRRSVLTNAQLTPEDRVLDLGCDTGELTIELAKEARDIMGIDSRPLFAELESNTRGARGVVFLCTGLERLPFEDETFDLIVSANSWHRLENRAELLYELPRVLKANGRLVIADICQDSPLIKLLNWKRRIRGEQALTAEELKRDFQAGYSDVSLKRTLGGMVLVARK